VLSRNSWFTGEGATGHDPHQYALEAQVIPLGGLVPLRVRQLPIDARLTTVRESLRPHRRFIQIWNFVMTQTMKAAVVRQFGKPLTIDEVAIPTPGPGEVLVKIKATGVCHTDLHAADGDWPVKPTPPFIPGHEGAGIVAGVGAGVKSLKEGDNVGIAWVHDACGACDYCITGWETLCESQNDSGYSVNGTFADYAIGSAAYVARLPQGVDYAAMAPQGGTRRHQRRLHRPEDGPRGWANRARARIAIEHSWDGGSPSLRAR
jgi:hypothetical protein